MCKWICLALAKIFFQSRFLNPMGQGSPISPWSRMSCYPAQSMASFLACTLRLSSLLFLFLCFFPFFFLLFSFFKISFFHFFSILSFFFSLLSFLFFFSLLPSFLSFLFSNSFSFFLFLLLHMFGWVSESWTILVPIFSQELDKMMRCLHPTGI